MTSLYTYHTCGNLHANTSHVMHLVCLSSMWVDNICLPAVPVKCDTKYMGFGFLYITKLIHIDHSKQILRKFYWQITRPCVRCAEIAEISLFFGDGNKRCCGYCGCLSNIVCKHLSCFMSSPPFTCKSALSVWLVWSWMRSFFKHNITPKKRKRFWHDSARLLRCCWSRPVDTDKYI